MGDNLLNWKNLQNPVYKRWRWSIKDPCMAERDSEFYIFFSAFYRDLVKTKSHVIGISTKDWKTFNDPLLYLDGKEQGWGGMCSPNLTEFGDQYYLSFNSWGDMHPNGQKNQLFYITSKDLKNWSDPKPCAKNLTQNKRAIDLALYKHNDKWIGIWKEQGVIKAAWADDIDGDFHYIGDDGNVTLYQENLFQKKKGFENFQIILIDGEFYLLAVGYPPTDPFIFKMKGTGDKLEDWTYWKDPIKICVKTEDFNKDQYAQSPFLSDWREKNGNFYLLYAGRNEGFTHAGRGNYKLALAKSKDLKSWFVP